MPVDVELRERAYIYAEFLAFVDPLGQPFIQTVYALYDYRLIRLERRYPLAEDLLSLCKVELRQIHSLSRQESVHIIVEKIDIQRLEILEIIISVLVHRRVTSFFVVVIQSHVKRLQTVYHQLHAQAFRKRRLAR